MHLIGKALTGAAVLTFCVGLAGCSGDDGNDGATALNSLVAHTQLAPGHARCPAGGVQIDSGHDQDGDGVLDADEVRSSSEVCSEVATKSFRRVATFPVCLQDPAACDSDATTAAEIVAASEDGLTLIYTDSPRDRIGFIDITDPAQPKALGTLPLAGEPTSVAVRGRHALVAVDTSTDFVNSSGQLAVVDIATRERVTTLELGGQPDSVAVSPDGRFAAVVIENQRDEDLGDGAPPQLPPGALAVVTLSGAPVDWTLARVDLTGIAGEFPADPEPEYVDINADNVAVVTLQENNHIVLVALETASVLHHFSAGAADLSGIDTTEEEPALIAQTQSLSGLRREPDGVAWLGRGLFATADEGDLEGGSRGFTVFNTSGQVVFAAGNSLEHLVARVGHYPDGRSENKGNEPENVEYGVYGSDPFLFVASERANLVLVYDVADPARPAFTQLLPAGVGPEGVLAIPSRNLLVVANEEDSRDDVIRGSVSIYRYERGLPAYPTIRSADRADGSPIPWAALSGLAADPQDAQRLYSIEDSFYRQNRIFTLDLGTIPAQLSGELRITDASDVFASMPVTDLADPTVDADHPTRAATFDEADLKAMINADKTVNLDPEGIAVASGGGFWIASEGDGTVGDAARPINSLNLLFKVSQAGVIEQVVRLPDAINAKQTRFGFEGVAESGGKVYVAFQRAWAGDSNARIGIYDPVARSWSFLFYPLDAVASPNGGWVGLSDLTALGNGQFLVVERDNQGGPDAAIKRLYRFSVSGLPADGVIEKTLVRNLLSDLKAPGGAVPEKIEGLAVTAAGSVYIVNDNDGVDDNSGETQLLNLGPILD